MILDSHQHYWKIDRGDYFWLTPQLPTLYRDYLPHDLQEERSEHGIVGTIVVQSAPTIAETEFLLSLAKQEQSIKGVVGWLDLALNDEEFEKEYARFANDPHFVGIRPMLHEIEYADYILQENVLKNLAFLAKRNIVVDLVINELHYDYILQMLQIVPNIKVNLNHLGSPKIEEAPSNKWLKFIEELAAYERAMCKVSGLITMTDNENWNLFDKYVEHIFNKFGKKRVMYGSDWPVSLLAGSYSTVLKTAEKVLTLTELEKKDFYYYNAERFYLKKR